MSFWGYSDYVSVADRRARAAKELAKLRKQGRAVAPVVVEGRKIATRFWGKAWCDNLERYSDFANRLPRGRSYVCNGLVIDLAVSRGKVEALVSGSETYRVKVEIAVAAPPRWKAICSDCAGSIGSLVELLQGNMSSQVMERVCRAADGLFPAPKEIKMSCSCPDWAGMCKHVAATLYGVGARLDVEPDVLFTLRGVDRAELVSTGADLSITQSAAGSERVLAEDDLSALFGLEIESAAAATRVTRPAATASRPKPAALAMSAKKAVAREPENKTARRGANPLSEAQPRRRTRRSTDPGVGKDRSPVAPVNVAAGRSIAAKKVATSSPGEFARRKETRVAQINAQDKGGSKSGVKQTAASLPKGTRRTAPKPESGAKTSKVRAKP